jgi:hypothetical protein
MIYFDFDMSKSTNTVVYFDWKTVNVNEHEKINRKKIMPLVLYFLETLCRSNLPVIN